MNQMNPILLDDRQTGFNDFEKLRIIMLYIISKNGIPEDSLTKLLSHANLEPDLKQIVINLSFLGPNVNSVKLLSYKILNLKLAQI